MGSFTIIPAATMLGGLAIVLARAEVRLVWGAPPERAIGDALIDHPQPEDIETAARAVWGIMVRPIEAWRE